MITPEATKRPTLWCAAVALVGAPAAVGLRGSALVVVVVVVGALVVLTSSMLLLLPF